MTEATIQGSNVLPASAWLVTRYSNQMPVGREAKNGSRDD